MGGASRASHQVHLKLLQPLPTINSISGINKSTLHQTPSKMNNLDSHPRILSLSSSSTSTQNTSTAATPITRSTRASHESAHDAHHFVAAQDKTSKTLNDSIKKMWSQVKNHAVEHHRSVNAAYRAQYGGGARMAAHVSSI
jgi:hypothetical protein